jgi:GTP-binding protein
MNPLYHRATFLSSAPRLRDAPPDQGLEIAFAGRSNAGKSSAINTLVQQNALARVSKTPGRTQLLNFFEIDATRKLVDLPGYGYAKVPEAIKKDWQTMMETYITQRKALCGIVVVMDIRHPLTDFDWQMIEWCQHGALPLHLLLTKADKLNFGAAKNTLLSVQRELSALKVPVTLQVFSALKKVGVDDIHQRLDDWFQLNQPVV